MERSGKRDQLVADVDDLILVAEQIRSLPDAWNCEVAVPEPWPIPVHSSLEMEAARKPAGNCFRGAWRVHPVIARRTAATHHRGSAMRHRLAQSHQKAVCLRPNQLAKPTTVLDKPRSGRSLEEEVRVEQGVATTKTEHTEVFNGSGSEGEELQRLGGHTQVERILCIRHAYPGVVIAALEARVQEDLTTLPEESVSSKRHAEEAVANDSGHDLGLVRVRIARSRRSTRCPVDHPSKAHQSSLGMRKLMTPTEEVTPKVKSRRRRRQLVKQSTQVKQQDQSSKGAEAKEGVENSHWVGRDLCDTRPTRSRDSAPRHQNGSTCPLHWCPLFPGKQSSHNCQRRDRHSSFPS